MTDPHPQPTLPGHPDASVDAPELEHTHWAPARGIMSGPVNEHWLVNVARAAGMEGADTLHVDADTTVTDAWALVTLATGISAEDSAGRVVTHFRLDVANLDERDPHADKLIPAAVAR